MKKLMIGFIFVAVFIISGFVIPIVESSFGFNISLIGGGQSVDSDSDEPTFYINKTFTFNV